MSDGTLKALVAAGREREGAALDVRSLTAPYSYRDLCTNVWKAGNLFGHYGVAGVGELALVVGSKREAGSSRLDAAEPVLALLGGAIVGATVELDPDEPVDAPALVAPHHHEVETAPGCSHLVYGGPPTDPQLSHFERELWSENPIEPPERVEPDDSAFRLDGEEWTHAQLLEAAADVVERYELSTASELLLETHLDDVGTVVSGVLAPMSVGATVVVPESAVGDGECVTVTTRAGERREQIQTARLTRRLRDTRRV